MPKPTIEVRVKKKNLSVKGKSLNLEDNFEGAGVFNVTNIENEIALELNYRKKQGFCEIDEQEKVYEFLRNLDDNELKKAGVYSASEEDFDKEVFPAVVIMGEFNAVVYNE